MRNWKNKELNLIRDLYAYSDNVMIARALKRTRQSITHKAMRLGLSKYSYTKKALYDGYSRMNLTTARKRYLVS